MGRDEMGCTLRAALGALALCLAAAGTATVALFGSQRHQFQLTTSTQGDRTYGARYGALVAAARNAVASPTNTTSTEAASGTYATGFEQATARALGRHGHGRVAVVHVSNQVTTLSGVLQAASSLQSLRNGSDADAAAGAPLVIDGVVLEHCLVMTPHTRKDVITSESAFGSDHRLYEAAALAAGVDRVLKVEKEDLAQIQSAYARGLKTGSDNTWFPVFMYIAAMPRLEQLYDRVLIIDNDVQIMQPQIVARAIFDYAPPAYAFWKTDLNSGVGLIEPSREYSDALCDYIARAGGGTQHRQGMLQAAMGGARAAQSANATLRLGAEDDPRSFGKGEQAVVEAFLSSPAAEARWPLTVLPTTLNYRSTDLEASDWALAYRAYFRRHSIAMAHHTVGKPWADDAMAKSIGLALDAAEATRTDEASTSDARIMALAETKALVNDPKRASATRRTQEQRSQVKRSTKPMHESLHFEWWLSIGRLRTLGAVEQVLLNASQQNYTAKEKESAPDLLYQAETLREQLMLARRCQAARDEAGLSVTAVEWYRGLQD